jgi:hypothetical protein
MKFIKLLLIGALLSTTSVPAFSGDGFNRSAEMTRKFREDQKRIWGDKTAAQKQQENAAASKKEKSEKETIRPSR